MGIFDFLKKNRKVTTSTPNKPATPATPKPVAQPNIVFPVAGESFTPKRLAEIAKQQPTWFSINAEDGSTRCRSLNDCLGNRSDPDFDPCRCAKCGYTIHLNLQPDFTCKVCGRKASAVEAVDTISDYSHKAVYDRSLWPITIQRSSGLPALLVDSIGPDGTDMDGCERAMYCFCINTTFRDRWNSMKAKGMLFPGEVEDLFTSMILYYMQAYQKKQPERNLFA